MSSKRLQPEWKTPNGTYRTGLKLYNSLTRQKEEFVPQNGRHVRWYSCGPTVYDDSHMGHARCYMSSDILRRVMKDYFNYDIEFCMNITDIDDKIIMRARQRHLLSEYMKKDGSLNEALEDVKRAISIFSGKLGVEKDEGKKKMYEGMVMKVNRALDIVEEAKESQDLVKQQQARQNLLTESKDILADWLDRELGSTVTDNSIFAELPRHFENEYHKDMMALNVLPADVLTRVSEYIPEVITFVQRIIENGFAYESNKSVYFDTMKFSKAEGHFYAKLVPEAFGDQQKLHEGEGDLSVSEDRLGEKKSPNDFALWKSSKQGEPSWNSPWGMGRPGWHIECSVMASSILGESLDIHSGGIDLCFPHHDNELAQAEAYFGNDHWVRYFLHSGHLHIEGLKMSKSLKNFITIKQALEQHTSRQLRLAFLLHPWKETLNYSSNTMAAALSFEKLVTEFFLNIKDVLRKLPSSGTTAFNKWNQEELELNEKYAGCTAAVHEALCDSIDTRSSLEAIRELITNVNLYLDSKRKSNSTCDQRLLKNITLYVSRMLNIFGTFESEEQLGFPQAKGGVSNAEELVMPFLDAFATFRDDVRNVARSQKVGSILKLCDNIRDDVLPNLGVRLEDHEGQTPTIKLVDREVLMKERDEKMKAEELKRIEKEKLKAKREAELAEKEAQKRLNPVDMFRKDTDKYSQFDDRGMPSHDINGKELSKSQIKKLTKLYDAQEKRYQEYIKSLPEGHQQ